MSFASIAFVVLLGNMGNGSAQVYPLRPIAFNVPFPAGGPTDAMARVMGERMRVSLGRPILIENVSGATGSIGVSRVAHAPPDGYTVGVGNWSTHVANGASYELSYDLLKDFAPVAPTVRMRMSDFGLEVPPPEQQMPESLGAFQKAEIQKWWPIIREANIKVD